MGWTKLRLPNENMLNLICWRNFDQKLDSKIQITLSSSSFIDRSPFPDPKVKFHSFYNFLKCTKTLAIIQFMIWWSYSNLVHYNSNNLLQKNPLCDFLVHKKCFQSNIVKSKIILKKSFRKTYFNICFRWFTTHFQFATSWCTRNVWRRSAIRALASPQPLYSTRWSFV